jgi:hypothetical protein
MIRNAMGYNSGDNRDMSGGYGNQYEPNRNWRPNYDYRQNNDYRNNRNQAGANRMAQYEINF